MENIIIGGRLHSAASGNIVTGTDSIYDDELEEKQSLINLNILETQELFNLTLNDLEDLIPEEASSENQLVHTSLLASGLNTKANVSDVIQIQQIIPNEAYNQGNELADKNFVNSSVATATATFQGYYHVVDDLGLTDAATNAQIEVKLNIASGQQGAVVSKIDPTKDLNELSNNNDYLFVGIGANQNLTEVRRFKYNGDNNAWAFEYTLNNSGFTSAQWGALNSGITSGLVEKLTSIQDWALQATKPSYTKSEVGLGNVDNTSDANKPISTATLTALNGLQSLVNRKVIDYSKEYLTFEAIQDAIVFKFTTNALQYSLDNGATWTTLAANTDSPTISAGHKIMLKQTELTPTGTAGIGTFVVANNFKAYGNIMSLYYGDNFIGQTDLTGKNFAFTTLFKNNTKLVDASNLILPATTLVQSCYRDMFNGCTSLTTAPILPATILANNCYDRMFYGCTSLTTAPELPATTLTNWCYGNMFQNCTSLTTAPELPATTLAASCYNMMFKGCTSLNYIKCLATDISASNCTNNWVTDVAASGTFVKAASTDWSSKTGTNGVPSGWTVYTESEWKEVKHYELDDELNKYVLEVDYSKQYLIFEAIQDTTFTFSTNALQYSLDNGATWDTLTSGTTSPTVSAGSKIMWKQTGLTPTSSNGIGTFSATGNFEVSGNIMSLYYGDNFAGQKDLTGKDYAFYRLFRNCSKLINIENLVLPATSLTQYCYSNMFRGCISLTTAPELPATTLAKSCYQSMFDGCTSLATAPELPATTLANYCYNGMFNSCTSLIKAPELPATTLEQSCYTGMFSGCTNLTKAPQLPAITLADNCYKEMFIGCTSLNEAPELPATALAVSCYQDMFYNCAGLTVAPELPATSLTQYCYSNMFGGCTALTTAPELPATTLTSNCYSNMFKNCTSLATAPELPATTLTSNCYNNMFKNCTALNYVKCLATDISASGCTAYWVTNVAASGTFVKADNMSSWTTGESSIPSGWTVYTESEYELVRHYELDTALAGKQNTISDLSTIRSGAALGATALQPAAISAMVESPDGNVMKIKTVTAAEWAAIVTKEPNTEYNIIES